MPVAVILKYSSVASARNLTEGEKKKANKETSTYIDEGSSVKGIGLIWAVKACRETLNLIEKWIALPWTIVQFHIWLTLVEVYK